METISTISSRKYNRGYNSNYGRSRAGYVEGSVARRLDNRSRAEKIRAPRKLADKRQREFAAGKRNVFYYLIVVSLIIAAIVGFSSLYLTGMSKVFGKQREITALETQLNDLKIENEEEYARIMGSVDLEEIKRVAMEELGMSYPAKSQMVSVADNDSDYVRQYGDFPTR